MTPKMKNKKGLFIQNLAQNRKNDINIDTNYSIKVVPPVLYYPKMKNKKGTFIQNLAQNWHFSIKINKSSKIIENLKKWIKIIFLKLWPTYEKINYYLSISTKFEKND